MPEIPLSIAEIDQRIAAIRENLTELTEQAAAYSGGAVVAFVEVKTRADWNTAGDRARPDAKDVYLRKSRLFMTDLR